MAALQPPCQVTGAHFPTLEGCGGPGGGGLWPRDLLEDPGWLEAGPEPGHRT